MNYALYTDGSAKGNGKEDATGGWAYVLVNADFNSELFSDSGFETNTTNQKMELAAAVAGLKTVEPLLVPNQDRVVVYTDSAYLFNCYSQKWYVTWEKNGWLTSKRQPVVNRDLWEQLLPYFRKWGFDFAKVKGHSTDYSIHTIWNNKADELAQQAAAKGGT